MFGGKTKYIRTLKIGIGVLVVLAAKGALCDQLVY